MRIPLAVLGSTLLLASSALAQVPAEVEACRLSGLAALKERSPSLEHLTFDIQSLAISKADTKVEDTPIRMVVMGEAYLQREKSDKPNRFICLISDKGKVVLTFFTEQ
ncbi:hypothetical protein [Microvirga sp. BSC39]|uniref:hypothetical protein n=1 Tax=Microvirga sp. BSC39 TaxID=1549810 RepID=UPI0004E9425E|nr:hypothetical protein [Microvirga sp. BSC39]KFG69540.1 hypothetical protein JH26_09850 [Microvirga sp. BSC39]